MGSNSSSRFHGTVRGSGEASVNEREFQEPKLSNLLRIIECPVCREVPEPPIHNCVNGHFICGTCRPHLLHQRCAYCLGRFTKMRNYPLESIVSTPLVPCDFVKFGCKKRQLTLLEYEPHLERCWAKLWQPGTITVVPQLRPKSYSPTDEDIETFQCPRCFHENSIRKIRCNNCDGSLRPPTPMKISEFNFEF